MSASAGAAYRIFALRVVMLSWSQAENLGVQGPGVGDGEATRADMKQAEDVRREGQRPGALLIPWG
ncbi:hypothetical protein GCM10010430_75950 [Kitasatospora cystarginea]|uniref:Uncharacterized protein n=1 Tax=Kitasatospora cystarginea TaxID=58350 RepID=A0ABP5RWN2_9ACTN